MSQEAIIANRQDRGEALRRSSAPEMGRWHRDGGAEQFIRTYKILWYQGTLLFFFFGLQAGDFPS